MPEGSRAELSAFGGFQGESFIPLPRKTGDADGVLYAVSGKECSAVPEKVTKTFNGSYDLETSAAAKLSVNWLASGSADVDRQMRVFVREYSRFATCDSSDGTTQLVYGAYWRATVLVDQLDLEGKLSFAVAAASATLKNRNVQVLIEHQGFADTSDIDVASQAAMKETQDGLTVLSYAKFTEALGKAADAVVKSPVVTPLPLIGSNTKNLVDLRRQLAQVFALTYISQGRGCLDAIQALRDTSQSAAEGIRETYRLLTGTDCNASDPIAQLKARQVLNGVRIEQK
jgi:hypothetical protein